MLNTTESTYGHPTIQERLVNEGNPKAPLLLHQFHPAIFGAAVFRLVCSDLSKSPSHGQSHIPISASIFAITSKKNREPAALQHHFVIAKNLQRRTVFRKLVVDPSYLAFHMLALRELLEGSSFPSGNRKSSKSLTL
jgi:hypothetical protein